MAVIVPTQNIFHFCRNGIDGSIKNGRPCDVERDIKTLEQKNMLGDGIEMFLVLKELKSEDQFSNALYKKISNLKFKSLHFGGYGVDFLADMADLEEKLILLSRVLERMEVGYVVIHAQHFKNNRLYLRKMLAQFIPNITVLIENDGSGHKWGGRIESLKEIFNDCPEFKLCLDICHIKELNEFSLWDMIAENEIKSRIRQIHISCFPGAADVYAQNGYPGYNPHHALFSIAKKTISEKTKEFISQYPIVIEGAMVREDKNFDFLKREIEILSGK